MKQQMRALSQKTHKNRKTKQKTILKKDRDEDEQQEMDKLRDILLAYPWVLDLKVILV